MGLKEYRAKRSKDKTDEPFGGEPAGKTLRFVVQKHAASHLHYDFRLEMRGVLKSWAVPKGPSLDPEVKRLAMMVEDHPYDYRTFEGTIPKGEYGGGTVMVWDEGTYEAAEEDNADLETQQKHLLHQLHAGKIKFILKGKKLKGEFALIKAHGRGENGWLLMKMADRYANTNDITLKDKSALSGLSMDQITKRADTKESQPTASEPAAKVKKKLKDKTGTLPEAEGKLVKTAEKNSRSAPLAGSDLKKLLKEATKCPFYTKLSPMLATLVGQAFDDPGWLYEVKWDGYRAVGFRKGSLLELKSRNDKSFNEKFYPVYEAMKAWDKDVIVDGEIVVVGDDGRANFGALQNWRSEADGSLLFYVFDLLWYNGLDLTGLPLITRKAILNEVAPSNSLIQVSRDFETSGIEFLEAARKMGLEGIMAKRKDSLYHTGDRTKDWLKIKANRRQEVVIGGYTRNEDTRKPFSSLLVGVFQGKSFVYTGKIGTGFSVKTQTDMLAQFEPLQIDHPPFSVEPDVNKPSRFRPNPPKATVTWLKPELICEVSFAEMTSDGVMRHPSFEGMRTDKTASEVVLEKETDTGSIVAGNAQLSGYVKPGPKKSRKTLLNPTEATQVKKVGGHELKFTNVKKVFWPIEKYTKGDLLNYYYQAAPFILPYLKDRPQSMNRFPNGIHGKSFYQKNVKGKVPDWMATYAYHSDADNEDKEYLIANDEATLLYMINSGCIELNPWSSTVKNPDRPTWCMIDFDPDQNTFDQVIEAARVTHTILEDMGIPSYPKTSGSTGLHIYIPLGGKYTYEQSKEFSRVIARLVHRELPAYTSIERAIRDREGKMYIDFLQNRPHATIAAPYVVRPKPGATVSMPLHWDEVKKGLKMKDFTIQNAIDRMRSEGDIFKPVLGKGIDLQKIISKQLASRAGEDGAD
ncbi:DNA ligase D [Pedobacter yulinensis]|uniref:DNA ligase (ATP) n=1 Tax=Pedobacter yulinensis TaxID=2126353 RepID=A0A2T3HK46_9SPHI|nr:DNA ligase D [Pedobacter yulinensis]PST82817.1 DNA ligase D [Pedobacter yulinensis]